ncbi:MAG TPA: hypothetical protein VFV92_11620 [Candidatus Bathyarchaeia archaeon]|nr:hypothetical protein [Candidatus Bathyarchaeia archaeon]
MRIIVTDSLGCSDFEDVTITVNDVGPAQNDAGSGGDAGNSFATATVVTTGTSYQGQLTGEDTEDWYGFGASTGNLITTTMTPPSDADFDYSSGRRMINVTLGQAPGADFDL